MKTALIMLFALLVIPFVVMMEPWKAMLNMVEPSQESYDVTFTASRYDSAYAVFPESEYTISFSIGLGEGFVDLEADDWFERLQKEIENVYLSERGLAENKYFTTQININSGDAIDKKREKVPAYTVHEIPSVEWLMQNITRGVRNPFLSVTIDLPTDGTLKEVVTREYYEQYSNKYPYEMFELRPMQIIASGQKINTIWRISVFPQGEGKPDSYLETLEDLQENETGQLLYKFADGKRYLLINLPAEMLTLRAEDLASENINFTVSTNVLVP